jgi:hypothetical protein
MRKSGIWESIVISVVLTPIALFFGMVSGGAGHGDYFIAKLLFPYTMLSTTFFGEINLVFLAVALIQFPFYGCLVAFGIHTGKVRLSVLLLAAIHILAVLICFRAVSENFS